LKKTIKIIPKTLLRIFGILMGHLVGFDYKAKNGFLVFNETAMAPLNFLIRQSAILVFSKINDFRYAGCRETLKKVLADLPQKNNWFIYKTEEVRIFNTLPFSKFKTVLFKRKNFLYFHGA
jgi:hypothetical protein